MNIVTCIELRPLDRTWYARFEQRDIQSFNIAVLLLTDLFVVCACIQIQSFQLTMQGWRYRLIASVQSKAFLLFHTLAHLYLLYSWFSSFRSGKNGKKEKTKSQKIITFYYIRPLHFHSVTRQHKGRETPLTACNEFVFARK